MVDTIKLMEADSRQIAVEIFVYQDVVSEVGQGNLPKERVIEAGEQLRRLIPLYEARVKVTN